LDASIRLGRNGVIAIRVVHAIRRRRGFRFRRAPRIEAAHGSALAFRARRSGRYHEFESSRLGLHYGNETDLQLQGKWRRFTGVLKYASYQARTFATDTTKYWLQLEYVL
jgi:hypothetical protein